MMQLSAHEMLAGAHIHATEAVTAAVAAGLGGSGAESRSEASASLTMNEEAPEVPDCVDSAICRDMLG